MKKCLVITLLCLQVSCFSREPLLGDIVSPIIVEVQPQGNQVALDSVIIAFFSEPVNILEGDEYLVVIAKADQVDEAFLKDFDRPPLTVKRHELLVAGNYQSELDDTVVIIEPQTLLAPQTSYKVVISSAVKDLAGNPLVEELNIDSFGRVFGIQNHVIHEFSTSGTGQDNPIEQDPDPVENTETF